MSPLLIVQGDPLVPKGISVITPRVAKTLELERGLIVLDDGLAHYHSPNADRDNVILETRYSEAVAQRESLQLGLVTIIERSVDALLTEKNQEGVSLDKPPIADCYQIFALL